MNLQLVFILSVIFVLVTAVVWSASSVAASLYRGLADSGDTNAALFVQKAKGWPSDTWTKVRSVMTRILKEPIFQGDWVQSPVKRRLIQAGLRSKDSLAIYLFSKFSLAITTPIAVLGFLVIFGFNLPAAIYALIAAGGALAGFFAPDIAVHWISHKRQEKIQEHLPDALDLIRICVEAGLGLDAAILRVSKEIEKSCPPLCEEFHMVTLELRAGGARDTALRNLASRTGLREMSALVTTLIQSDRFGTGIAETIRIHSDSLRVSRRMRAEELSAKMSTKLLFPLIFCIFPSLLLVLIGPAVIMAKQHLYQAENSTEVPKAP
jgi:tight adherence protein C